MYCKASKIGRIWHRLYGILFRKINNPFLLITLFKNAFKKSQMNFNFYLRSNMGKIFSPKSQFY